MNDEQRKFSCEKEGRGKNVSLPYFFETDEEKPIRFVKNFSGNFSGNYSENFSGDTLKNVLENFSENFF